MSDEPNLTADEERSMWERLSWSPYITPEERRIFALRAAAVADTSGEVGRQLDEAIERERARRRRDGGFPPVTTLPPHAPQQRLDPEEWEALSWTERTTQAANAPAAPIVTAEDVERARLSMHPAQATVDAVAPLPPGMAVAHSLNTAAYITSAAPNLVGVSWDMASSPSVYVGNPKNDFGQLISRLLGGVMQNVTLSWRWPGSTKRLSFEIEVPNDMSYETMVANMHALSRELGSAKTPVDNNNRRRLLKLEEEA